MSDYKNTLNLPQTDFPMKANLAKREPLILEKWEKESIYESIRTHNKGKEKFILHAGPPYANGHIHLGTATTTVLKDIIVKAKTLMGYDAPYVPGWDCHGLPIELNVEKKIGKPGAKVSAAEFRKACREYANRFIDIQRAEFKRLGVVADWEKPYLTMAPSFEADIIRSLAKILKNGHIQKGYKPVHWCLDCGSALAEAEVEYAEKISPSIDVKFNVVDPVVVLKSFPTVKINITAITIPIWTTTPWTLPANQAVALHPELVYALVSANEQFYIVAEDLVNQVFARYGIENHQVLGTTTGDQLESLMVQHPFYDKSVPVVLSEHVTAESGTGAVHIAPSHGQDDFIVAKKYQLPLMNPLDNRGCYTEATPLLTGLHVTKGNDQVIALLKEHETLLQENKLQHSYPHCWRHKTPLIFRATPQWFISMEQNHLRTGALAAIERVEWIPDWGKQRIIGMIENRPDWCISRQRTWGVPIPLFIHKDTGEIHPQSLKIMETLADQVEHAGIEAWYELDKATLLGPEAELYDKSMDVLDVWFDSGVTHEAVLQKRNELNFPADIVLEGSDQHRGWFQSSLLTSIAMNGVESYKQVLTHGFVVDANGRKMSKSLGNVIAPQEVIQSLGADILRLWVASVDYRTEISASIEILTRMSEAYRRIRNTARFLLANLNGFDPQMNLIPAEQLLVLDRFIVDKAGQIQKEIEQAYDTYQFHIIIQKLHHFCAQDLGGFYLDIIKDRQYTLAENSVARRSAQTALYHIINMLVRWMAPILSFTAEEIWQYMPNINVHSVFISDWYQSQVNLAPEVLMNQQYWETVRLVRDAVNKEIENQRNAGKIGSALEAEVNLYCAPDLEQQLRALQDELRFVLITATAKVFADDAKPNDAISTEMPNLYLKIEPTLYPKCERCWHRQADVSANLNYPGICGRCVENIAGQGEQRKYA